MKDKLRVYINRKFLLYPKTNGIVELKEELFSMMCDKYDDCQKKGLTKAASYKQALTFMEDYKTAIREVERGSSLEALRKKLVGYLAFTAFYFTIITAVYLFVSMVTLHTFEKTWLIIVAGAFIYLIYFAINMFGYAKMFDMPTFSRISLALLFLSFVPALYVFPSLFLLEAYSKSVWNCSWLIIPVVGFIYIITDLSVFGRKTNKLAFNIELASAGLVCTASVYLFISYIYNLWGVAWIIFVVYLAIIALAVYINEKIR
jgi:hypothetical protein